MEMTFDADTSKRRKDILKQLVPLLQAQEKVEFNETRARRQMRSLAETLFAEDSIQHASMINCGERGSRSRRIRKRKRAPRKYKAGKEKS